ncbi:MAG: PTS sugar transporter subunit IIA [Gemmatimonadetes bacterium]|nr:PTS sugar transporter subunit IIA [Gemmatimonadota bacterium]NNK49647.1 PTS sugar transporter subunit IIA [Gemmatimonadota bacterium]
MPPPVSYAFRSSATSTRSPGPPLTLSSRLTEERIKVPLDSLDKPGILRELCLLLATAADSLDRLDDIHRAVIERESVLSTGVGSGIALPHGKCPGLERFEIVAGTTREPVDFEAVDGDPVRLVVMMVGPPAAAGYHVKTLGHISRTLRDAELRAKLSGAEDAVCFRRFILEAGA